MQISVWIFSQPFSKHPMKTVQNINNYFCYLFNLFQKGFKKTQKYISFDIFTKNRKSFFLENIWVFTEYFIT